MEGSQIKKLYQRISDIEDYIKGEEAFLRKQKVDEEITRANLKKEYERQERASADFYQNATKRYRQDINQLYNRLHELGQKAEQELQNTSTAVGIFNLVKGAFSPNQRTGPRQIAVYTVDECRRVVNDLEMEYNRLLRGGSLIKEPFLNLFETTKFLMDFIRTNSEDIIGRSAGRQRVEAVQSLTTTKEDFDRANWELDQAILSQKLNQEGKLTQDLSARVPAHWLEEIRYEKTRRETKLSTNISLHQILKSDVLKAVLQNNCQDIMHDGCLQIPAALMEKDQGCGWIFLYEDGGGIQTPIRLMHSMMADALENYLDRNLKFAWIDSVEGGENFAPFASIRENSPELFLGDTAVRTEEIKEVLRKVLANTSDTKMVCVTNFPRNFDEDCLRLLAECMKGNSPTYFILISRFDDLEARDKFQEWRQRLDDVKKEMEILQIKGEETAFWRNYSCHLQYSGAEDVKKIVENYGLMSMQEKYPYIMRECVYEATKLDNHNNQKLEGEIKAMVEKLKTMVDEPETMVDKPEKEGGGWKGEKFPSELTLGKICYPESFFKDPTGILQMDDYKKMTRVFSYLGMPEDKDTPATLNFPWEMDLAERGNLYLKASRESMEAMQAFTHAIIWNFLDSMPVSKFNISIFDTEQMGNSISPFLPLKDRLGDVFGKNLFYTSEEEMQAQLHVLKQKIEDFNQNKRGKYKDFLDYNAHTPKRSESAVLLVIYDFPGHMNPRMIADLKAILKNGNACGIYTLLCHNTDLSYREYGGLDDFMATIKDSSMQLEWKNERCYFASYDIELRPAIKISIEDQDQFIREYVEKEAEIREKGFGISDILAPEEAWFQETTADHLKIPMGVGDGDQVTHLVMGENQSHHTLIAGATGSGKSVLLHSIIISSMLTYSPEELKLYLMDFKSGTEFAIYDKFRLPHIKLLALDAMQEFGESILESLVKEMERRAEVFKAAEGPTKIQEYVRQTGKKMPRILVVMDEFQILYNEESNRAVARNCAKLTQRLVTEGRSYGIHLLMATQSTKVVGNLALDPGTIEQMRVRVGLKCSDADSRYLFGDENYKKPLEMMKGPIGTAVLSSDYTEGTLTGFRGANCESKEREDYLKKIQEKLAAYKADCRVFEGNRTEKLIDSLKARDAAEFESMPLYIHYGSPIKVAPQFVVKMTKKQRNNLLICCGGKPRMANRVANDYMISALMNQKIDVYCMDGNILLEELENQEKEMYRVMASATDRFHLAEDRGQIIRMIDELYETYVSLRKKGKTEKAVVVVLKNLEYLDIISEMLKGESVEREDYLEELEEAEEPREELTEVEKAFGDDLFDFLPRETSSLESSSKEMSVGDELIKLFDQGSAYGIYFALSTLDYQTIRETMVTSRNYDKEILKKFPNRIISSLNDSDAQALIPDVTVDKLPDNTVYYWDGIQQKFQLKPFVAPDAEELRELLQGF